MKRSEATNYLYNILKSYEDCELDYLAAVNILEAIEDLGMLPPGREEDSITFSRYSTGEVLGKSFDKYEWDPE